MSARNSGGDPGRHGGPSWRWILPNLPKKKRNDSLYNNNVNRAGSNHWPAGRDPFLRPGLRPRPHGAQRSTLEPSPKDALRGSMRNLQRQLRRFGPNGFGEELNPGAVDDSYLGLLVDQPLAATLPAPGSLLVVGPSARPVGGRVFSMSGTDQMQRGRSVRGGWWAAACARAAGRRPRPLAAPAGRAGVAQPPLGPGPLPASTGPRRQRADATLTRPSTTRQGARGCAPRPPQGGDAPTRAAGRHPSPARPAAAVSGATAAGRRGVSAAPAAVAPRPAPVSDRRPRPACGSHGPGTTCVRACLRHVTPTRAPPPAIALPSRVALLTARAGSLADTVAERSPATPAQGFPITAAATPEGSETPSKGPETPAPG
jgi:hypothetical protein